jgi:hypothetical protein
MCTYKLELVSRETVRILRDRSSVVLKKLELKPMIIADVSNRLRLYYKIKFSL